MVYMIFNTDLCWINRFPLTNIVSKNFRELLDKLYSCKMYCIVAMCKTFSSRNITLHDWGKFNYVLNVDLIRPVLTGISFAGSFYSVCWRFSCQVNNCEGEFPIDYMLNAYLEETEPSYGNWYSSSLAFPILYWWYVCEIYY